MTEEAGRTSAQDKTLIRQLRTQLADSAKDIKELTSLAATAYAERALTKSGTANAELLVPHVAKRITFTRGSSGSLVPAVLEDDGKTIRITGNAGSAANMSTDELVGKMQREGPLSEYFGGETPTTGATDTRQTTTPNRGFEISAADAQDHARYLQVRKQAADAGRSVEVVG